ncbi:hypothetical protein D3C79_900310 [compost metagenome]
MQADLAGQPGPGGQQLADDVGMALGQRRVLQRLAAGAGRGPGDIDGVLDHDPGAGAAQIKGFYYDCHCCAALFKNGCRAFAQPLKCGSIT